VDIASTGIRTSGDRKRGSAAGDGLRSPKRADTSAVLGNTSAVARPIRLEAMQARMIRGRAGKDCKMGGIQWL
jgi:hypothetical protein